MKISKKEYKEYEQLKDWAKTQKVYQSVKSITDLKDDIDIPIRKSVAMLALLGCEPIYSCCGFDYDGQLFHKSHQFREPYIKLTSNIFTTKLQISIEIPVSKIGWQFRLINSEVWLQLYIPMNPHWNDKKCIHSSEECVIGINALEEILKQLSMHFMDEVTLFDTNSKTKKQLKHWQYIPKNPWTIKKEYLEYL